jgi:DNA-binding NarL/FixJ family response regulator
VTLVDWDGGHFRSEVGGLGPIVLLTDVPAAGDADSILPRAASPAQIDAAVRAVSAGLTVHVRRAATPRAAFAGPGEDADGGPLTARELQTLAAVGEGLSNKAVARRLGISAHTVKFHMESIFAKLGTSTRAEAVAKGLRRGLIEV